MMKTARTARTMSSHPPFPRWQAICLLILLAVTFGSSHVCARIAFDHGTSIPAAIAARSSAIAVVVLIMLRWQGVSLRPPAGTLPWALLAGVLLGVQSALLYSAVARIPVALALLVFNTFPMLFTLLSWMTGGQRPSALRFGLMLAALFGLSLVLNLSASTAKADGNLLLLGTALALGAAAMFACIMLITEKRLRVMDGRKRSLYTMVTVAVIVWILGLGHVEGLSIVFPADGKGWLGVVLLTLLFGTAMTTLLALMPRLDMARNGSASNIEPIATLGLAWAVLDQTVSPQQMVGAVIVVLAIAGLGLVRR